MKKAIIKISGMTCAGCSSGLEKYLNKQSGIIKAEVNLVMSNAKIEYDEKVVDLDRISDYVRKAGFRSQGIDKFEIEKKSFKIQKIKLIASLILGFMVMVISMAHMVNMRIPHININDNPKLYGIILAFLATSIIALSFDIIINGIKKIIHKIPNMDSLISLGVIASYLYSSYCLIITLFVNSSCVNNLCFESSAMVIVFTNIGRYLDNKSRISTKEAITKLMTITPSKATIIKDEYEIKVNIDEISKGDIVICRPGEKIAVDGIIVDGHTHIDEKFITGESMPVDKKSGDNVLAGSINLDGYIEYRAERIGKESLVSEIVTTVANAVNSKPDISKYADKICLIFVPVIISIAILTFTIWIIKVNSITEAINFFVSVLVVACPCALGLATPMATTIANNLCVKTGIIVKNNKVLEKINKIDTVVFDKTGTLTEGFLKIDEIHKYNDLSENGILQLVGTIERKSEHPIAKAIVQRCIAQGIKLGQAREIELISGVGVKTKYKGEDVLIGSKKMMLQNNITIYEEDEQKLYKKGNIVIFVAIDNKLVAVIGLKDKAKSSAKETIQTLLSNNKQVIMLTGDNEKTANITAEEIGIINVISNALPSDKAKEIEKIKQQGKNIMMVGDGINDAPSLAVSDVSVSVEGATDIALDTSDVVIMNSDLNKINELFNISKKTFRIIKQNLFWAFIYNIIMIPVACGILSSFNISITPLYSAIAMTISSLTVILNSLRLNIIK